MRKRLIFIMLIAAMVIVLSIGLTNAETESPFNVFQEVLLLIDNYHVDKPEINELVQGAIKGMVETLDPYSQYMTEEQYKDMQTEFEGHFGGIGIVITPDLTIVSPIKGTPGEKVGLMANDKIRKINGESTKDMTQKQAVDIMRGEPGTPVDLSIEREGSEDLLEFHIIRSDIEVPYVEWEMKEDKIGYIGIYQFVQDVGDKVAKGIAELETEGARAIILDLRSNPGGLLNEAVTVTSNFIGEGTVVSVKQRYGEDTYFKVDSKYQATDLPLVVLINQGSASASEIVSGAVQDYGRGILIGMKSFGKGTVQSIVPLSDGSALRLTTARYYTPNDRFIHEKGIEPDIEVEYNPDYEGENDNQLDRAIEYIKTEYFSDEQQEDVIGKAS